MFQCKLRTELAAMVTIISLCSVALFFRWVLASRRQKSAPCPTAVPPARFFFKHELQNPKRPSLTCWRRGIPGATSKKPSQFQQLNLARDISFHAKRREIRLPPSSRVCSLDPIIFPSELATLPHPDDRYHANNWQFMLCIRLENEKRYMRALVVCTPRQTQVYLHGCTTARQKSDSRRDLTATSSDNASPPLIRRQSWRASAMSLPRGERCRRSRSPTPSSRHSQPSPDPRHAPIAWTPFAPNFRYGVR